MSERDIFTAAREMTDPAARSAYLDGACGGDPVLRSRVEALLRAHDQPDSLLDHPAVAPHDPASGATAALNGVPGPVEAATQTAGGDNGPPQDEALTFLAPPTRPDSLGRIGHYEVLQVLGKGGFGIVFRAFDEVLQRVVALKVLAPQLAATSPARKRFLREARSSAQVRHENVVQVYEVAEQPLPYLAMEFIPGETLQQRLNRVGPLDVPEVLRIGRQIAEGLAAAHATDLIHRDIKPGNILLEGAQHKVKITDFGLARAADDASISQSGVIAGTPMYMAPEQATGEKLDQRADLFSLGSVLYQMVSGRPPFRANTVVAVLKRVAEDRPRDIREIVPEAPQWLCDIIAKLHAKGPDERYQSAREVADVLADCEAQLKSHSRLKDYSRIPRSKPRRSGRRNWAAVAAAVLLLPVIALAVTEFAGVTHLFRGQTSPDRSKSSNQPNGSQEPLPPTFTNSIGMEFVIVPKGKSWLGGGKEKLGDREVVIPADFYLGKYEVTQEEWKKVMGESPSQFSRTGNGKDEVKDIPDADLKRFPVENVSWDQCQVFVAKLNKLEKETGWVYRLPTETEWEYACRGGPMADRADSAFDFYLAEPTNTLTPGQANFKGGKGLNRTCKVGSYEANRLGLFDMHGNVGEWCEDTRTAADQSSRRVTRGGTIWNAEPKYCRAGFTYSFPPSHRNSDLGLRLARVRSDTPSPAARTPPIAVAPFTDADAKRIAALPPAAQVEELRKELKRRNPGFAGDVRPTIEREIVTGLDFSPRANFLGDLSPLKGMKLTYLNLENDGQLRNLEPLRGMPLERLMLWGWGGSDLSPLHGMPLKWLNCGGGYQKLDFTPLAGSPLEYLCINHTQVTSLATLKNVPLTALCCANTPVSDLSPLKDLPLTELYCGHSKVSDLSPLKGKPLKFLHIEATGVSDLTPLQGLPLEGVRLTPRNVTKGLDVLRGMKGLKTIGIATNKAWPAAEFWERYDKGEFGLPPFSDADARRIAALPAEQQVEEVRKRLMRRNPGFDGELGHKIEDGAVTELRIVADKVSDIAPIRVFNALRRLECSGTVTNFKPNGLLADLTPLKGMNLAGLRYLDLRNTGVTDAGMVYFKDCKNLTFLNLGNTRVSDAGLACFKDCKDLWNLHLGNTKVTDKGLAHLKDCKNLRVLGLATARVSEAGLAHFKGCKNLTAVYLARTQVGDAGLETFKDCKDLRDLHLSDTKVTDKGLAHLKGVPLKALAIQHTGITDLTPLRGMPLEKIRLTPKNIARGLDLLRAMKGLKTIGVDWDQAWPAAEFWERYDRGEFE